MLISRLALVVSVALLLPASTAQNPCDLCGDSPLLGDAVFTNPFTSEDMTCSALVDALANVDETSSDCLTAQAASFVCCDFFGGGGGGGDDFTACDLCEGSALLPDETTTDTNGETVVCSDYFAGLLELDIFDPTCAAALLSSFGDCCDFFGNGGGDGGGGDGGGIDGLPTECDMCMFVNGTLIPGATVELEGEEVPCDQADALFKQMDVLSVECLAGATISAFSCCDSDILDGPSPGPCDMCNGTFGLLPDEMIEGPDGTMMTCQAYDEMLKGFDTISVECFGGALAAFTCCQLFEPTGEPCDMCANIAGTLKTDVEVNGTSCVDIDAGFQALDSASIDCLLGSLQPAIECCDFGFGGVCLGELDAVGTCVGSNCPECDAGEPPDLSDICAVSVDDIQPEADAITACCPICSSAVDDVLDCVDFESNLPICDDGEPDDDGPPGEVICGEEMTAVGACVLSTCFMCLGSIDVDSLLSLDLCNVNVEDMQPQLDAIGECCTDCMDSLDAVVACVETGCSDDGTDGSEPTPTAASPTAVTPTTAQNEPSAPSVPVSPTASPTVHVHEPTAATDAPTVDSSASRMFLSAAWLSIVSMMVAVIF